MFSSFVNLKWYKKQALHILDVVLLSACAQYEKSIPLPDFQMYIIRVLLEMSKERRISSRGGRCSSWKISQWLTDHHFPDHVPSIPCQLNALKESCMCMYSAINPMKRKEISIFAVDVMVYCLWVATSSSFAHTKKKFKRQKRRM
jgi:hypothetical protein